MLVVAISPLFPPGPGISLDPATQALSMDNRTYTLIHENLQSSMQFKQRAKATLEAAGIPVLGDLSYNISLVMEEQHLGMMPSTSKGGGQTLDCLHFCQPGGSQNLEWWVTKPGMECARMLCSACILSSLLNGSRESLLGMAVSCLHLPSATLPSVNTVHSGRSYEGACQNIDKCKGLCC